MRKKRTILWVGILLLLLLIAAGRAFYLYNKPHQGTANVDADMTISADSLYKLYSTDEHAADIRFLNKVILVSGTLSEIQHNNSSEIWILSPQPGGGGINCQLTPNNKTSTPMKPGEPVKIKGRCTGFLMDVNLADCVIGK